DDPIGLVDVAAEYDGLDNLRARYLHGLGLVARMDAGETDYYSFDALGNTRQITGNGAAVSNEYDYDAFGSVRSVMGAVPNLFRFDGRHGVMTEGQAGAYFMRNRRYSSGLGRFSTEDPIGFASGDPNAYRYVFNDATNLVDPEGL